MDDLTQALVDLMATDVFASVVAYKDPDVIETVRSMLDAPGLTLRIGVVLQSDDAALADGLREIEAVDLIHLPAAAARGPCFARALAQTMYEGEYWYYQCDAHMRFDANWALALAACGVRLGSPRFVLSSYPLDLADTPEGRACVMGEKEWSETGLSSIPYIWKLEDFGGRCVPARFLAAGNLFAPGAFVAEVPYDPRLYFQGEEFSLALRAWTAGYDLWHPPERICLHRYNKAGENHPHHWADFPETWTARHNRAARRLAEIYGWEQAAEPLGIYGLGRVRGLAAYEKFAGIDLARRDALPDAGWRTTLREAHAA